MGNFWISPNVQQQRPTVHQQTQKEIDIVKYADLNVVEITTEGTSF